jgi:hypothetical protein
VAEIPAKKDKKWADNKSVLEEFKAEFYQKWRKRDKENFEKMFLILQLYTGRKTISGPGNIAPSPLVVAQQLSLYLGGGTSNKISHSQKDLEIIVFEKIC